MHLGSGPIGVPGRVEESVTDGEGQGQARPGCLLRTPGSVGLNELASIMGWSRSTVASMAVRYAHLFPSRQEYLTSRLDAVSRQAERERSSTSDDILMTMRKAEGRS